MDIVKKIQIFGDSVMKGVQLDVGSQKYYTPKIDGVEQFQKEFPLDIRNYSKFGCTIEKGLRLLEKSLERGARCDMAVLEYGGNDCDYDWAAIAADPTADHQPHTPPKMFEAAYRKMLEMLRQAGIRPIVMTLPPIDAEKYLSWICRDGLSRENIVKWLGDVQMIYRFQELYSATAERVAREMGVLVVDVRSVFLDKHNFKDLICEDGIHPNENGHRLIRGVFAEFTENFLRGQTPAVLTTA